MKAKYLSKALIALALLSACKGKDDTPTPPQPTPKTGTQVEPKPIPTPSPKPQSDAMELKGKYSERLRTLLNHYEVKGLLPLGETEIKPEELAEIKRTTDALTAHAKTEREKYDAIFEWIKKNIKYKNLVVDASGSDGRANPYNSAYRTFAGKEAICQGYANLLKVMCYTQGINAPVGNGLVHYKRGDQGYGHAWNYVRLDGEWYVSDPTSGYYTKKLSSDDHVGRWEPERIDFPLAETSEYQCMYVSGEVSITKVKAAVRAERYIVPEAVAGFAVTSFNPEELSASVQSLTLSKYIRDIGREDRRYLRDKGINLREIIVASDNPHIESYEGILYSKGQDAKMLLIPSKLEVVKLKPMKVVEKNTLLNLPQVRELHFAEGTERIESSAVENCPLLQKVYLPRSIQEVDKNAFEKCHKALQQIRR